MVWKGVAYAKTPMPRNLARRLMALAERFGLPLLTFIDTAGAYPGIDAEARGQAEAIARSQAKMVALKVPTVACVIGEGGSGGALALAVADRVLMQENAIYSVISPEGCAMILWRDRDEKKKAATAFKPDAFHCYELGVIDGIVSEPKGGAQRNADAAAESLKRALVEAIGELDGMPAAERRAARRAKFRAMGVYS